ncbi:MAG: hypothetical protein RQ875_09305 [Vicingaceae bacterium]|nr:hypothetical protein [Vicingaceae bacterium]
MKYFTLFTFLVLTLSSCDRIFPNYGKEKKKNKEKKEKIYDGIRKNYLDGKLASTVTYKDSVKNGVAINYYPDGKINMEFNYKDNMKDGPFKWYYENGVLYLEGNYEKNEKEGIFKMYRDNGQLKSEMPWHKGLPCVGLKEYYESGKLKPVPKIIVKHKNTVKLDNKYTLEFSLSDNSKNATFYDGYLGEKNSFANHFVALDGKKGKASLTYFVVPGKFMMKSSTIVAKLKTRDDNYYILTKEINVTAENR